MISRVTIHIGSHKTGSTYLQQYLHDHRDELLLHGFFYPELEDNPQIQQHSALALALREPDRKPAVAMLEKLAEEARAMDADALIISGEEFFFATEEEVAILLRMLENSLGLDCEFRVLAYVRNTYDYVRSQFNQHLRFESYPFNESYFVLKLAAYVPGEIIRRWENVFGADKVDVFSYDEHRPHLLDHFLSYLGIPHVGEPNITKLATNPSIDFLSAFVINQLLFDKSPDTKHTVYSLIVKRTETWDDFQYGSEVAMIESVIEQLHLDLSHPKLQPIASYITAKPERSLSTGREKEAIWRLMLTLDVMLTRLEQEEQTANELAETATE